MKSIASLSLAALAACAVSVTPAFSADDYSQEEISSVFDIAFGTTLTSRYISRGVPQSSGVALQGYIEPSYDIFYVGVWASNVKLGDDRVEYNLYGGIRPEFGNLSLDIGYAHYLYNRSGACCGEFYGKAYYTFIDEFTGGVEVYYDPKWETTYGVLAAEVALPYDFTLSAGIGTYFERDYDWNVGVSYTWNDYYTFDVRYHDANHQRARFTASVSVDLSAAAIFGW